MAWLSTHLVCVHLNAGSLEQFILSWGWVGLWAAAEPGDVYLLVKSAWSRLFLQKYHYLPKRLQSLTDWVQTGVGQIWVHIPTSPLTSCLFPSSLNFLFLLLSQGITVIIKWNNTVLSNHQSPFHHHHSFPSTIGCFSHREAVTSKNSRGSKMLACSMCQCSASP